jgi:hypothetical protein
VEWYSTPAEAAKHGMPLRITHVVETRYKPGGDVAYVLLAIEANPTGFDLDENIVYRSDDGGWTPGDSAGGGFTARTLDDLRADPPPQGLSASFDRTPWPTESGPGCIPSDMPPRVPPPTKGRAGRPEARRLRVRERRRTGSAKRGVPGAV